MIWKSALGGWVVSYVFLSFGLNDGMSGFFSVLYLVFVCSFPAVFYTMYYKHKLDEPKEEHDIKEKPNLPWE